MNQTTYQLTRHVVAEEIDAEENITGTSVTFDPVTRFTIIHEPYAWSITQTEHCTIHVDGKKLQRARASSECFYEGGGVPGLISQRPDRRA